MKIKAFAAFLAISLSQLAHGVVVDHSGTGQVLIVPFYSTVGGNDTLITVSREVEEASTFQPRGGTAIKVLFRTLDGSDETAFNVYLTEEDSWAAALTRRNGQSLIVAADESCVLAEDENSMVVPVSEVSLPVPPPSEPPDVIEKYGGIGFFQVIEMAETTDPELADLFSDCDALAARWNQGAWADDPSAGLVPSLGRIRNQTTMINVERGTAYSYGPRALSEFSDIVQHTRPSDPKPDLGSAHDAGTDDGATTSRLCDATRCVEDQWANPIDAVRVALLVNRVAGEFSVSEALGARTEGVLTFPAANTVVATLAGGGLFDVIMFSRRNGGILIAPGELGDSDIGGGGRNFGISFGVPTEMRENDPLPILGPPRLDFVLGYAGLGEGWIQLNANDEANTRFETATHVYRSAAPAVPIFFQEFVNGTLMDSSGNAIRANYGFSIPLSLHSDLDIIYQEKE